MPKLLRLPHLLAFALGAAGPAVADDITGANLLLCSVVEVTYCPLAGDCEIGAPWTWNIPQFIEADVRGKELRTTRASGENRATPLRTVERANGQLLLQGFQNDRAFSLVINERSGMASMTVAAEGMTLSAFGACTPLTGR